MCPIWKIECNKISVWYYLQNKSKYYLPTTSYDMTIEMACTKMSSNRFFVVIIVDIGILILALFMLTLVC